MNTITNTITTLTEPTPIIVSDPCYLDDDYSGGALVYEANYMTSAWGNAAPGKWLGTATIATFPSFWGKRVTKAGIHLEGATVTHTTESVQGVDAGMVGFFLGTPALTYDDVCNVILSVRGPSLIDRPDGKVWLSTSGFGDGGYPVTISWNGDQIVGVEATYVSDEEVAAEAV